MVWFSERQRKQILIVIRYRDHIRSQHEVSAISNKKYPNTPFTQLTVSRIYHMFEATECMNDLPKTDEPLSICQ